MIRTQFMLWVGAACSVFTLGTLGCGQRPATEPVQTTRSALSVNSDEVLGFEKSSDWHVTSSPPIALSASSTASQGSFSLAVPAKGYVTVQGATISLNSALSPTVSFDLSMPAPVNPSWAGAAQLYVDCHSHSLFNQYLGQQELTGQPTGKFVTESYSVPASIQSALAAGCSDLSFTIAINVPTNQTGNYLLDNLQLGGSPTVVSCQSTIGQADAGAATVALTNQVTRPDLGTFVLNTTIAVGDPQTTTRNVSLNGKPLYDVTTQAPSSGASTTTLMLFPPILGAHQISTTSDGTTFTVVADGRQSVPMPVQTNLSGLKFQDGQPPPKVTIPPGVSNAIAQLMVSAGTQLPTCLAAQTSSSSSEAMQLALVSSAKPTSGLECEGCFWKCYGLDVLCAAAAPFVLTCSVLTSFLGPLGELLCTEVVDVTACVSAMHSCERSCTAAGSSCCPVDCGGANQTIPTTGTCCESGDSCAKRATSSTGAICCTSDQPACGGACCGSGNKCLPDGAGSSNLECCDPSQVALPGTYCCFLGACKSNADCHGAGNGGCGSDGCCRLL